MNKREDISCQSAAQIKRTPLSQENRDFTILKILIK